MNAWTSSATEQGRLDKIRTWNEQRKTAEANGVIGGARAEFDIDFLLRYIDAQKPHVIDTFSELSDFLQDLNYEHGMDTTAITVGDGSLFFAFCTDPDGDWLLDTTDPRERFEEEGDDYVYVPLTLDVLRDRGPFTILHKPGMPGTVSSTEKPTETPAEEVTNLAALILVLCIDNKIDPHTADGARTLAALLHREGYRETA